MQNAQTNNPNNPNLFTIGGRAFLFGLKWGILPALLGIQWVTFGSFHNALPVMSMTLGGAAFFRLMMNIDSRLKALEAEKGKGASNGK
ncbi:MAG: hypothetical protein L0220_02805 [Acidobacteria bacterium]|nr:hypothetical protein [Acidobacteriota bacterium]